MKKKSILIAALALVSSSTFAGGILTNTNQNVAFNRNFARNATFEIDGAYSNPAGLAWIGEGFHLSANWQAAFQTRVINTTYAPLALNGAGTASLLGQREYKGKATAPVIPSLQAAYQKGDWTVSMNFAIGGGGGKCEFADGLPMFESMIAKAGVGASTFAGSVLPSRQAKAYTMDTWMQGAQYIYGLQLGATYRILDNYGSAKQGLSVYVGARMNYVSNKYEGYVRNMNAHFADGTTQQLGAYMKDVADAGNATIAYIQSQIEGLPKDHPAYIENDAKIKTLQGYTAQIGGGAQALAGDLELDCSQAGFGVQPIIGIDYRIGKLNIGARYEFMCNVDVKNDTKKNSTGKTAYDDGVKTVSDIPAILSLGAQYEILPSLRAMAGWTYYFDKDAEMSGNKQKTLDHNTSEILFGVEYDVTKRLTLSVGGQTTNYGATDAFQNDLAFSCDSYSLGLGAKIALTKKCDLNVAYFFTDYKDYERATADYNGTGIKGTDIYSRTNHVAGIGVNYHF